MKKWLFNVLVILLLGVFLAPTSFAGIPISEQSSKVVAEPKTKQKKVTRRISKLKQKIARKMVAKQMEGDSKTAAIVFGILIPFVGVAIYQDRIGKDFWITLLLTALLYVPGLIYALSIILKRTR